MVDLYIMVFRSVYVLENLYITNLNLLIYYKIIS